GSSEGLSSPILTRRRRYLEDKGEPPKKCSYTFLALSRRSQGQSAPAGAYTRTRTRVTRMDVAAVRDLLSKQRREMDTLKLMKLLRKESRNMNSRVTQLYIDNSLELAQLEGRILNATAESLRLAARYRDLEVRYAALSAMVNSQSVLVGALEERCLQVYGRRQEQSPQGPPLVQVVPENIPVSIPRFTNEIQRDHGRAFPRDRGSQAGPAPTGSTLELQKAPQGNFSAEGPFRDCLQAQEAGHGTSGMYLLKPGEAEGPMQVGVSRAWTTEAGPSSRAGGTALSTFRNWDAYKVMMKKTKRQPKTNKPETTTAPVK
uniref:Angiopoietin-like 1b n=1 Tax=Salmo trutta TaxID=8032 RepID=A0A673Z5R1_SALTR